MRLSPLQECPLPAYHTHSSLNKINGSETEPRVSQVKVMQSSMAHAFVCSEWSDGEADQYVIKNKNYRHFYFNGQSFVIKL